MKRGDPVRIICSGEIGSYIDYRKKDGYHAIMCKDGITLVTEDNLEVIKHQDQKEVMEENETKEI